MARHDEPARYYFRLPAPGPLWNTGRCPSGDGADDLQRIAPEFSAASPWPITGRCPSGDGADDLQHGLRQIDIDGSGTGVSLTRLDSSLLSRANRHRHRHRHRLHDHFKSADPMPTGARAQGYKKLSTPHPLSPAAYLPVSQLPSLEISFCTSCWETIRTRLKQRRQAQHSTSCCRLPRIFPSQMHRPKWHHRDNPGRPEACGETNPRDAGLVLVSETQRKHLQASIASTV
jgi:hypothetical protein